MLEAIFCPNCGRQVENLERGNNEQIIINNYYSAIINTSAITGRTTKKK